MTSIVRKRDTGEKGNRGEFGTITRRDVDVPVPEATDATGAGLIEKFGFDVRTADPVDFDGHAQAAAVRQAEAASVERFRMDELHRAIGDRKPVRGPWEKTDKETLAAAREWVLLADGGAASEATGGRIRGPLSDAEAARAEHDLAREQVRGLEEAYRIRGGWNRAFLVASTNGHVHSSMDCSTCRPTTQFAWMTQYSGADEDAIVADAGHRACTTCYPSAPLGDANSLPTKMFTPDEVDAQRAREKKAALAKLTPAEKRARKRAEKLADAVSRDGRPLRLEEDLGTAGKVRELISTERDAERVWRYGLGDAIRLRSTAGETLPEFAGVREDEEARSAWQARIRPQIARTLAEKHGTTAVEEKRRLDGLARTYLEQNLPKLGEQFEADSEEDYLEG